MRLPRVVGAYRQVGKSAKKTAPPWSLAEHCGFSQQLAAATSAHKRRVLDCSRRAGKSKTIEGILIDAATSPPFTNVFYITNTKNAARKIIWGGLKALNRKYELGGIPNETESYIAFPQLGPDVHIYLAGAKDAGVIENLRGPPSKLYVIDEAQSMPERVRAPLMKEVISPALMDYNGSLVVAGTPPALPSGYFYDICHGDLASRWERHAWTWRENKKLPAFAMGRTVEQIEADILEEHGWSRDHPTFLREYCGIWAADLEVLVFKWDAAKNAAQAPAERRGWSYVMGIDLGFEDSDAIAVLGWSPASRDVYLVDEDVTPRQGLTALGEKVSKLWSKYGPAETWVDSGGLGRKIIDELQVRWSIPCQAAEKTRKLEHIEILNDALRTGRFKAPADSRFAEDCGLVQWDVDARARGQQKVADDYHSDITDAVLYAYRAARGYLQTPADALPEDPIERARVLRQEENRTRIAAHTARMGARKGPKALLG